jgi:hypothetical protein
MTIRFSGLRSRALAESVEAAAVAFEGGVGDVVLGPGEDAGPVALENVVELDERAEPGPVEEAPPADQEVVRAARRMRPSSSFAVQERTPDGTGDLALDPIETYSMVRPDCQSAKA